MEGKEKRTMKYRGKLVEYWVGGTPLTPEDLETAAVGLDNPYLEQPKEEIKVQSEKISTKK